MADEIQMTARLYASKNGAYLPSVTYTKSATMVGVDMGSQTQLIGTSSSETLDVPVDVSTPYKLLISNLDTTNYVELSFTSGFAAGAGTMRLPAGETMLIPYINTNLYLIANTSSVTIQATFCEI
jgi:hypothetical protein